MVLSEWYSILGWPKNSEDDNDRDDLQFVDAKKAKNEDKISSETSLQSSFEENHPCRNNSKDSTQSRSRQSHSRKSHQLPLPKDSKDSVQSKSKQSCTQSTLAPDVHLGSKSTQSKSTL